MSTTTTSPSEKYDCRSCGACCQGFPLFACTETAYTKYRELYEYRGLTAVKRGSLIVFITEPCQHLSFENNLYTCKIQDHKPLLCKLDQPGGNTCHEARAFYLHECLPTGLRIK